MSTSYKNTLNTFQSKSKEEQSSLFVHVTEVRTQTNNVELEGSISGVTSKGKVINSIFPQTYSNQYIPLLGEVVPIFKDELEGRYYYKSPINIHNFPTHNSPNSIVTSTTDYKEPSTINPYSVYTGDTLLQGRFGQSIRFSQSIPNKTPWSGSLGNSIVVISSGQLETTNGNFLITEDINLDPSSIYLTEDIALPLTDVYQQNAYKGNQIVVSSDRVHLHARKDNVVVRSQQGSIELSTNSSIDLQDSKWKATLTEILDLIEMLGNGGNLTDGPPTGQNIRVLEKLTNLRNLIE